MRDDNNKWNVSVEADQHWVSSLKNILPGLDSRMNWSDYILFLFGWNNLSASESDHEVLEIVHEAEFKCDTFVDTLWSSVANIPK